MSSPRIIAGQVKGFRLQSVPGNSTRPITDRVKGALFNILEGDIQGATLLDLFAGTGSVGIEALSRGAEYVLFIDNNHKAIETLRSNIEHTGFKSQATITHSDAFTFLRKPSEKQYDYIYIAPPQYQGLWLQALQQIDSDPFLLTQDGWVIVQINPIENKLVELKNLTEFDQRKYGDTLLIFYRRPTQQNE